MLNLNFILSSTLSYIVINVAHSNNDRYYQFFLDLDHGDSTEKEKQLQKTIVFLHLVFSTRGS